MKLTQNDFSLTWLEQVKNPIVEYKVCDGMEYSNKNGVHRVYVYGVKHKDNPGAWCGSDPWLYGLGFTLIGQNRLQCVNLPGGHNKLEKVQKGAWFKSYGVDRRRLTEQEIETDLKGKHFDVVPYDWDSSGGAYSLTSEDK